jgi:hypothetical protein
MAEIIGSGIQIRSNMLQKPMMLVQTKTPYDILSLPSKQVLLNEFEGKPIDGLRTPCLVVDRHLFARNCARMHQKARDWGASFRAHLKTHKVQVYRLLAFSTISIEPHMLDSRRYPTPAQLVRR